MRGTERFCEDLLEGHPVFDEDRRAIAAVIRAAAVIQNWWENHGEPDDPCPICDRIPFAGCKPKCPGRRLDAALDALTEGESDDE